MSELQKNALCKKYNFIFFFFKTRKAGKNIWATL